MPLLLIVLLLSVSQPSPNDVWIHELQKCENLNHVDKILDTNGKYSYGDYMFQMDTWLSYGKKFGATRANIGDPNLQYVVAKSMLDNGGWRHWLTCGKKATTKLGYPYPVRDTQPRQTVKAGS